MSIEERVIMCVAAALGTETSVFTPATNLRTGIVCDSLDQTEIMFELEDEFNVAISDQEADKVQTVADIIKLVEGKILQ